MIVPATQSLVVVPCYNESKRFKRTDFATAIDKTTTNFLFVNDGSSDNGATLGVIKSLKRTYPKRVDFISLAQNKGKAEAVRTGLVQGVEMGRCSHIGFFDADGAVPLSHTKQFSDIFEFSNSTKAVIGVRSRLAGHDIDRTPAKFLSQKIISMLARGLGIPKVMDTQCGAKLFDAKQLQQVLGEQFISKWLADIELLARLARLPENKANPRWLFEYPVPIWKEAGNSTRPTSAYLSSLTDYMKLYCKYQIKRLRA